MITAIKISKQRQVQAVILMQRIDNDNGDKDIKAKTSTGCNIDVEINRKPE